MAGYGFNLDEEEEDPFAAWPSPMAAPPAPEEKSLSPLEPPVRSEPMNLGRSEASYNRSDAIARAQDRENDHASTRELIGNIGSLSRRESLKTSDSRELFAKQRAELASEAGQAKKRAKADPASERSMTARGLFAKTYKDAWDKMDPKIRDRMSEDYILDLAPVLKDRLAQENRDTDRATASAKDVRDRINKLGDTADERAWREGESEKNRRSQEKAASLSAGTKADTKADDDRFKWSGRVPDGVKAGLDSLREMDVIAKEFGGIDKIPGLGLGEGAMAGAVLPPRAQEFRQTGSMVISKFRNKMFGASLTPGEKADFEKIANLGGTATVSQVANALRILKKGFTSDAQQGLAGAPEEAKASIYRDLGIPYGQESAGSQSTRVIGKKTYTQNANGDWEVDE
jgi:hypothetical protein